MSTNNSSSQTESVDFIDFFDIWRAVMHFKLYIFIFVSIVTVLAILAVSKITPTYVATATLLLKEQKDSILSLPGGLDLGMGEEDAVVTEIEVLGSRNMMAQVIEELDMTSHPAFTGPLKKRGLKHIIADVLPFATGEEEVVLQTETIEEANSFKMIGLFDSGLSLGSIPQTQMITVSFESSSPELARDVANTMAELYIKRNENIFKENAEREAQWLDERLYQLRVQMQGLEETLSEFLEENDLVVTEGVSGLSAGKIKQLKTQVLREQKRNLELSTLNALVEGAGIDDVTALLGVDYVAKNATVQLLRQNEMQAQKKVNELNTMFGPKHPKMIAAQSELSQVKEGLLVELRSIASNAKTNLAASDDILKEIRAELKIARQEHQHTQKLENQFIRLTREIDSSRELYEKLLQQSLHNRLATASHVGFASLVDPAIAPPYPTKPKKKLLVGIAIVMSIALSVTVILVFDAMMNDSFRSASDVRRYLDVPLLGIVPRIKKKKDENSPGQKGHKRFLEAIRTIKTNLILQLKQDPNKKVISITSTLIGEGKSLVAKSLAESLAGQGKVLLVDADLRRPSLGPYYGLPESHMGLSDLLKGEASFIDCVHLHEESGVALLPAGTVPEDPLDLLFSPRFHLLLKRIKQHYRYVVIDSVQTEAVSDAFVIARKADALVYVIKSNSTKREHVTNLFDRLRNQGIEVSGVVATHVDVHNNQNKERFANYYDFDNILAKHAKSDKSLA